MNKRTLPTLLILAVLLTAFSGARAIAAAGGCSGIIVNDADATLCSTTAGNSALQSLLALVADRLYFQYADANAEFPLADDPTLSNLLALVADRLYFQYADANAEYPLETDTGLTNLLAQVADRLYFQYADANAEYPLAKDPTLANFLAAVADRLYFQYADANAEYPLSPPCALLGDVIPPALAGPINAAQMTGSLTITWDTDEVADSAVKYGAQPGNYPNLVSDPWLDTAHTITLTGLSDGITYYYRVESVDPCGNTFTSGEQTFTIVFIPAVEVSKTAAPSSPFSGEDLNYTLVVTNTGDLAFNATIVDDLPDPVTPNNTLTWNVFLAPGAVWTQTIQVIIDADYEGQLTNTVNVTTDQGVSDSASVTVTVTDPEDWCNATITTILDGDWNDPAVWNLNRVPNASDTVLIRPGQTIEGPVSATVAGLCNFGYLESQPQTDLGITATGPFTNTGYITGLDGVSVSGGCGGKGSALNLRGYPFYNTGLILAGDGGTGPTCGGDGGNAMIYGRDTTNHGTIMAGAGGSLTGNGAGAAGDGGDTHLWGKYGGAGYLLNNGFVSAGDGGNGFAGATAPQQGGCGGTLKLISLPSVFLSGGIHSSGIPGNGTGGGSDGCPGSVFIEPDVIDVSGPGTVVTGGNIIITCGVNCTLNLGSLDGMSITATDSITLAVGSGSVIDLTGNAGPVLEAGNKVVIAADTVLLDPGVTVTDIVDAPEVDTVPALIIFDVSLTGAGQVSGQPGEVFTLAFTVLNGGPLGDAYTLSAANSAGWSISGFPSSVAVAGLDLEDLSFTITAPASSGATTITITAVSQTDPNVTATLEIILSTEPPPSGSYTIHLPIILR